MSFTSLGLFHRKNSLARVSTKWKTDAKIGWFLNHLQLHWKVHTACLVTLDLYISPTQPNSISVFYYFLNLKADHLKGKLHYSILVKPLILWWTKHVSQACSKFSKLKFWITFLIYNELPSTHRIWKGTMIVKRVLSWSQVSLLYANYFRKVKSVFKNCAAC